MKVLIGTKNASKIKGAKLALEKYYNNFEIKGVDAPSGVVDQPVNEQTFQGAKNRVDYLIKFAKQNNIKADLFMAVEAGLVCMFNNWQVVHFAIVSDGVNNIGVGTSASFPVPNKLVDSIKQTNLGEVISHVFNKKDMAEGSVYILTNGAITRTNLVEQAFSMALTKLTNGDKWKD